MRRLLPLLLLFGLGCPVEEPTDPLDDPRYTDQECRPNGETRCFGVDAFQVCQNGYWFNEEICPGSSVCSTGLGCVSCEPLSPTTCSGDDIRICEDDGSLGAVVDTCPPGQCEAGYCIEEECPEGTDLIYVVDSGYRLLSFDPREGAYTFNLLGALNCPGGPPWPSWGGGFGSSTPFSMSVDRRGTAWILYTSGEIFWVPTNNVDQCSLSPWQPGTDSFELFGMGFVSSTLDASVETLYIAGGTAFELQQHATGRLGAIDPEGAALTPIGSLTPSEFGPELTGTGGGELFAYFPGTGATTVARLDQSTGQNQTSWPLPGLGGPLRAWAFAHWGGMYYIFVSFDDAAGQLQSQVHRFDPATGESEVIVPSAGYRIVGAGVSTCAPLITQ